MEETSALNNSELTANTSVLPQLVVIYTPVLLVQLLVGLVSNLLLIALLVKANSVNGQNNVNIYLYSVAINNLLSLFPVLTLLLSTVTKKWVLGQTMCSLNQFAIYAVGGPYILLQVFISRERYKAVVHFAEWKPYSRRTYIHVAAVWICAICSGVIGLVQGGQIVGKTDDVLSCYTPSRRFERSFLPVLVVFILWLCASTSALLAFALVHYVRAFRELYVIKEIRLSHTTQPKTLQQRDIPISWEAEVRTLKSVAVMFFVSLVPYVVAQVCYYAVAMVAVRKGKSFHEVDVPLIFCGVICAYLTPTASPLLLIVMNKRFRTRMKDLFRWQLKPTNAVDPSPVTISHNKVVPLNPSQEHQCDAGNAEEQFPTTYILCTRCHHPSDPKL